MKNFKRIITGTLALMVTFGCAGTYENVGINNIFENSVVSVKAEAVKTLADLQAKFPQGKYWNHVITDSSNSGDALMARGDNSFSDYVSDTECYTHNGTGPVGQYDCNSYGGGIQCCGFAKKLAYEFSGTNIESWAKGNVNNLKAGDVVHYYGSGADAKWGHWVMITSVNGDTVTLGECNAGGKCNISWTRTISKSAFSNAEIFSAPFELPIVTVDILPDAAAVEEGVYRIRNKGTGLMINYGYGTNDKAFYASENDGSVEQTFRVVSVGGKGFKIENMHPDKGFLNFDAADGASVGSNVKITKWNNFTGDCTQTVYFRAAGNGLYVITSTKGSGVIGTSSGTEHKLFTQNYKEGNANQLWELVKVEESGTKENSASNNEKIENVINEPTPVVMPDQESNTYAGDINADGKVDITDLSELSLSLVGDKKLTDKQKTSADVDRDGEILLTDLAKLKQYISRVIDTL